MVSLPKIFSNIRLHFKVKLLYSCPLLSSLKDIRMKYKVLAYILKWTNQFSVKKDIEYGSLWKTGCNIAHMLLIYIQPSISKIAISTYLSGWCASTFKDKLWIAFSLQIREALNSSVCWLVSDGQHRSKAISSVHWSTRSC